ncbi:hypothetical protein P8C59_003804 [Phyllachora maydis]|uniref:Sorting nexin/Vps5-like C-terminal domain-containing protein n=1 Tax=Phyllachora maydis TaxID=1825666 RepID=A0AAD9I0Z3_9PEZI|nr:hypothetical protein P8C59_003804 [Phyllachora maydis]
MWNDEDNNPYGGSFESRDSFASSANQASPSHNDYHQHDAPHTPPPTSDEPPCRNIDEEDSDEEAVAETRGDLVPRTKPGGYDSRIEQMLYENPEMPVLIIDAGKSTETGGRYIVYTIKTGELVVRRRYSEFASMEQVRTDGVWWRFLDPNSSWNEVLHSHPVASVPKSVMKAPPSDPANPTQAHSYLPIPASSARLKTGPINPNEASNSGAQGFARLPPESNSHSEHELDPYFVGYEASIRELEGLLTGPMEKVNRRTLSHLSSLASDLSELGAKYNAFSLSEQDPALAPAIEKIGQAADSSYIATEELSTSLGASFAEPMREHAQFAGVVRSVLRYRVLKRVQQEMTTDDLNKKRALLDQLERSEAEARRIDQYLSASQALPPPRRSTSVKEPKTQNRRDGSQEDTASIDSDFPPTHGDFSSAPSAKIGSPERRGGGSPGHKKTASSGNSITNKIFGPIRHAVQGVVDVDPERTRRDTIGKTRESITHLEQAQVVSAQDVKDASASILKDLKRFQKEKEDDLKRYMLAYAKSQMEWAKKNKETWEEAKAEVDRIDES